MKRTVTIILCVIMLMTLSISVSAGPNGVVQNPTISMPNVTPTVDGNITDTEGWSAVADMNYDTLGFFWHVNPLTMNAGIRFAWDEENFYYCADIVDGFEAVHEITGEVIPSGTNSFIYATGTDNIDERDNGKTFGYNGDVFGMLIDPLALFVEYGFTGNEDNTPWYLVSLFEGDNARMYREEVNSGDVTEFVKVAGHKTDAGWCFEAAIPWDMIIKDVEDIVFGEFTVDKEQLFTNGAKLRVAGMYHDRFYDVEAEEVATWGCFVTVPTVLPDGTPGEKGTGTNAMSLGIDLSVVSSNVTTDTTADTTTTNETTTAEESSVEVVTDEKGSEVTDEKGNKVTQIVKTTTKKATTGNTTGSSSAQTFDMGIAIAAGTLAASVIGIIGAKRRK